MANTLTNLIPTMYAGLNKVSRELVGIIPAVRRDSRVERAAVGQTVLSPVVPANSTYTITPAVNEPDTGDQTVGSVAITLTGASGYPIRYSGEEELGLGNAGTWEKIMEDNFAQAFRALGNRIEADLATLASKASRAYGTAGTTPFGTADNLTDLAGVNQILSENGAPVGDRHLVLNLAAGANLRGKQPTIWRVNEAGSQADSARFDGSLGRLMGFDLHESGQLVANTAGTGSGYLINNASGYAVGSQSLTLDTGTGTILAGNVVTLANDTNKYVVSSNYASNTLALNAPGLRKANVDNAAVTVGATYTPSLAFSSDAIVLATRLPATPQAGDKAIDRYVITDPLSGLSFEVSMYPEYKRMLIEVAIVWGYEMVNAEHAVILLG